MRILVVEDERRIAKALQTGLEQENFAVDLAYTGTQALDFGLGEEYDLIILDLMIPEVDGLTVCKTLREKGKKTPILILTAKSQLTDKVVGLDEGADDYLTKPFAFEELLARIRALLRRPTNITENTLKYSDLTLDPISFQVKRGDQQIQLSKKEFALLRFLLRHPNQTLAKDKIIAHVWDYDADILPNTLEATIKNLRKKVDQPFESSPSLIQTVRGFGYKIEER